MVELGGEEKDDVIMVRSSIHLSSVLLLPRTQQLPHRSTERGRRRGPDASEVGTDSRGAHTMAVLSANQGGAPLGDCGRHLRPGQCRASAFGHELARPGPDPNERMCRLLLRLHQAPHPAPVVAV